MNPLWNDGETNYWRLSDAEIKRIGELEERGVCGLQKALPKVFARVRRSADRLGMPVSVMAGGEEIEVCHPRFKHGRAAKGDEYE